MNRRAIQFCRRCNLHDLPQIHHGGAIANVAHHREVVRNEEIGEPKTLAQLSKQVEDLRLHAHVERTHRLIRHHKIWVESECTCHTDALTLPTRELMGIPLSEAWVQPDQFEELSNAAGSLGARANVVDVGWLTKDRANGHARVQRGVWVLEDHLHAAA